MTFLPAASNTGVSACSTVRPCQLGPPERSMPPAADGGLTGWFTIFAQTLALVGASQSSCLFVPLLFSEKSFVAGSTDEPSFWVPFW